MENNQNRGPADLPQPKRKPAAPSSDGAAMPKGGNLQKGGSSAKKKSSGDSYSDTMQLQIPSYMEYDEYEEQGSVDIPPVRPARRPQPQRVQQSPTGNPQHRPKPQSQKPQQKPPQRVQQKPPAKPAPKKKKRRRPNVFGRFLRKLAFVAACVFVLYSAAALFMISKLERLPEGSRTVTSGSLDASHVRSILLIGTDARNTSERGRSDSMILASINSRTQTVYLTSFMRDAYVEIPDHGKNKLNSAYSFGGAELLMDTLELNYGVSIDDYVVVSFSGFAGIIDAFGGVEITMSDAEAEALNTILISEVNELMGDARESDLLNGGGTFTLSGKQALSYARIRYVGNADFERTSRQREVMSQLFGNLKTRLVTAVPELVSSALPHVGTNMSTMGMYGLSLRVPFVAGYHIQQLQIPADGTWSGQNVDGQSVLVVDFAENQQILNDTVYAAVSQDIQSVTEEN